MSCLRATALVLCLVFALAASRRCCPDDEVFLTNGRQCAKSVDYKALNCTSGKYLLNPEARPKDHFTVLQNGTLAIGDQAIDPEHYCVTKFEYKNGTETQDDVAFVCYRDIDNPVSPEGIIHKPTRHLIMGVIMYISVAFMLLMIVVYVVLPEMRDLEGKCLLATVVSFCIAFSMLAGLQFTGSQLSHTACAITAFFEYFWMLSAFFWLNIVAFNLWKSVVCPHTADYSEKRLFVNYCIYGWGSPMVFLITAIIMDHVPDEYEVLKPDFGRTACWFHGRLETWLYFYGPIAALIGCNILFFVWTAWKLWRNCRDQTEVKLPSLRFKCTLYAKLLVIMGIPWIFELLSFELDKHGESYFWFATDILNGLQGVLIFLITVVCRKRVLKGLRQHRSFGINWPKKWAAVGDEESHAILPNDDVELSPACVAAKILS